MYMFYMFYDVYTYIYIYIAIYYLAFFQSLNSQNLDFLRSASEK